ncbi:uncharacterized protein LOC141910407 [Tubulanus polymorphus]|uniref:uncharacterized protein LOC141910407 n=1 Tax=Tubulanus polymorphus TaxID=672921 RepID=UPI003DA54F44
MSSSDTKKRSRARIALSEFASDTNFHGVRYIFHSPSLIARLVESEVRGLYPALSKYYGSGRMNPGIADLNSWEMMTSLAHRTNDTIKEASFQSHVLSISDFQTVLTDYGVCFSYQQQAFAKGTGVAFGLVLLLNLEQYEYMEGQHREAGLRVLVHSQNETARVKDLGLSVPVSQSAMIGVRTKLITNLEQPYGPCKTGVTSGVTCRRICTTQQVAAQCGCQPYYANGVHGYPYCTVAKYYNCFLPKLDKFRQVANNCTINCPPPCVQTAYQTSVSYTSLSSYMARGMASVAAKDVEMAARYAKAREVLHRVEPTMVVQDYLILTGFQKEMIKNERDLKKLLDFTATNAKQLESVAAAVTTSMEEIVNGLTTSRDNYVTASAVEYMSPMVLGPLANFRYALSGDILSNLQYLETFMYNDTSGNGTAFVPLNLTEPLMANETFSEVVFDIMSVVKGTKLVLHGATQKFKKALSDIDRKASKPSLEFPSVDASKIKPTLQKYNSRFIDSSSKFVEYCDTFVDSLKDYVYDVPDYETWYNFTVHLTGRFEPLISATESSSQKLSRDLTSITVQADSQIFYAKSHQAALNDGYSKLIKRLRLISTLQAVTTRANETYTDFHRLFNRSLEELASMTSNNMVSSMTKLNTMMTNISLNFASTVNGLETFISHKLPTLSTDSASYWRISVSAQSFLTKTRDLYKKVTRIGPECTKIIDHLNGNDNVMIFANQYRKRLEENRKNVLVAYNRLRDHMTQFNNSITINEQFIRDNYVYINVFYTSFNREKMTKSRAYLWFALICDIGGSAGLYLGASLLAMAEIFHFIAAETQRFLCKNRNNGNKIKHGGDQTENGTVGKNSDNNDTRSGAVTLTKARKIIDHMG